MSRGPAGDMAMVICDMWDTTPCVSAAQRAAALAPRIHDVAGRLRRRGALIVHAPAGCMEYYAGIPARERARTAPRQRAEIPTDWRDWDAAREAPLPPSLADVTPCSCEPDEPRCTSGGPPYPWTHQADAIEIGPSDVITDDGNELLALLGERRIEDVVIAGVHSNRCVLGRPYGIRQLVYAGKRPVLCRDLTDSYHRDARGHQWGNDHMMTHIAQYWCPVVHSGELS